MTDPMIQARASVQRYWNVDGLHEIVSAVLFLLTAVLVWATSEAAPISRHWKAWLSMLFAVVVCGGILLEPRVVRAIRTRLTFPRTGFVAFRKPPGKRRAIAWISGALVACLFALAVVRYRLQLTDLEHWLVALAAAPTAILLMQIARQAGTPRFFVTGVISAVAGVAICLAGVASETGLAIYFGLMSFTLLISGGLTLWRYLKTSPAPAEE
jgi:hypothetical protein